MTTVENGPPYIQAANVWRAYSDRSGREVVALRGVNLEVDRGAFVALKGRSGSGKTTLLNCLGGLDQPTSGAVRVRGRDLAGMSDADRTKWRRSSVGFVFQSLGLLPTLSAFENVELMLRIARVDSGERRDFAMKLLSLVGLADRAQHRPYELSGGQQQRVAVARALANRPEVILADEPTGELDDSASRDLLQLLRGIVTGEGVTLIIATHDRLVDEFADRVVNIRDGRTARPGDLSGDAQ